VDHELIAYLDERFRESARQMESFRAETSERLDAADKRFESFREEVTRRLDHLDEQVRHTRVVAEGLRHELHIVAEGVMGLSERLAAYQSETLLKFDEVRASMVPYYQDLNRRVGILEGRADRQTRDVIDVIREKFGKPQA